MMIIRMIAAVSLMIACAVALLPLSTLGLFYAVLSSCILLALMPVSVEAMMSVDLGTEQ